MAHILRGEQSEASNPAKRSRKTGTCQELVGFSNKNSQDILDKLTLVGAETRV